MASERAFICGGSERVVEKAAVRREDDLVGANLRLAGSRRSCRTPGHAMIWDVSYHVCKEFLSFIAIERNESARRRMESLDF